MTTHNKKTPAPGGAGNEGNELGKRSITTAYLLRSMDNSNGTYGTRAGLDLPMTDFIPALVPVSFIHALEPTQMMLHSEEVCAYDTAWIKQEKARIAKEREEIERRVRRGIESEYAEEYERLDAQAQELYAPLDALIEERVQAALEGRNDRH